MSLIDLTGNFSHCRGTHIEFRQDPPKPGRKTLSWQVVSKGGIALGQVTWFTRWRKYCFFPYPDTVYEEVCLQEIAEFLVTVTRQHRQTALSERASSASL